MSIKPFSEVVETGSSQEAVVTPFVDNAKGGVEVEDVYLSNEAVVQQKNLVVKTIGFLGSLRGVVVMFVLFTLVVLLVDAIGTVQEFMVSGSVLDIV